MAPIGALATKDTAAARRRRKNEVVMLRTKLCAFHLEGKCKRGEDCSFAHEEKDMNLVPDLGKTSLCLRLLKCGWCPNGDACHFAHAEAEVLRAKQLRENQQSDARRANQQVFEKESSNARDDGKKKLGRAAAHTKQSRRALVAAFAADGDHHDEYCLSDDCYGATEFNTPRSRQSLCELMEQWSSGLSSNVETPQRSATFDALTMPSYSSSNMETPRALDTFNALETLSGLSLNWETLKLEMQLNFDFEIPIDFSTNEPEIISV
eukprot:GEMP01060352.1.p1 GENE.GEMP01060352.1~~GEMP01060352.1.p1  ORF type:complete len:265 (+),score=59.08 GEMP01060352.1:95-889(+)